MRALTEADFWLNVAKQPDGCWLWTGRRTGKSYQYGAFGKSLAHRASWIMANLRFPKGEVDHRCRNTLCVNPDHLEDVTGKLNRQRSSVFLHSGACKRGHPYTAENTYERPNGQRFCRVCRRLTRGRT